MTASSPKATSNHAWRQRHSGTPGSLQGLPCRVGIREGSRGANLWIQVDVDCAEKNGFDETDKKYLEELAALLGRACDW